MGVLFRAVRPVLRSLATRSLSTTPARVSRVLPSISDEQVAPVRARKFGMGSTVALAGSPLFLTDFTTGMYFPEIQFVVSGPMNYLVESWFECERGPLFLNGLAMLALMRLAVEYAWWQPSYL